MNSWLDSGLWRSRRVGSPTTVAEGYRRWPEANSALSGENRGSIALGSTNDFSILVPKIELSRPASPTFLQWTVLQTICSRSRCDREEAGMRPVREKTEQLLVWTAALAFVQMLVAAIAGRGAANSLLAVNFQEVVHSVRTGNADVARPQQFAGGPNGHPRECPPDPKRSRGHGSRRRGSRAEQGRRRPPVQHHAQDRRQMGRALQSARRRWFARPILKTSFIAKPNSRSPQPTPSRLCAASAAPRSTSRPRLGISKATVSRILKRRGLSLLSSLEPQEPSPRYEREKPGEIIHHRHQKARPLQQHRPSHHR